MAAEPDVWTDDSLVEDKVSSASSAGAGCVGRMPLLVPVVVFVLFLAHCSLFRGLRCGVLFLLFRLS